jgi:hypothetical protein
MSFITPISRRLRNTGLMKYPRFERSKELVPAREIDPEAERFVPVPPNASLAVSLPPKTGWTKVVEAQADVVLPSFNQLLIYRALRLLYGEPDVVAAIIDESERAAYKVAWGFTLTIKQDLLL